MRFCSRTVMASCLDETNHDVSLEEFESSKKYKEQILKEIIAAVCAMLNANGGKVVIHFGTDSNDIPVGGSPFSQISLVIRILEQEMMSIIGLYQTVSRLIFKEHKENITISVKEAADFLITTNYNLYLPSQKQVVEVSPMEPLENVKHIIQQKLIENPVELGSHCKIFRRDEKCGFFESIVRQFKLLKAGSSKRTKLADRITGKGNKLSCYVSAYANHSGGHIYYGITDNGVVKGEFIPNKKDSEEIIKKVEKVTNKMIWPEQIGQPKRGEQWEIFFEPVVDTNNKPVPSTFVIVIYIAPCLGGVFTDVPECYEMVGRKVKKMSFASWRKGIWQTVWLRGNNKEEIISKEEIPPSVGRVTWSSDAARRAFTVDCDKLRRIISNGRWNAVSKECRILSKSHLPAMKLLVLSKQITACNRRGKYSEAHSLLDQYRTILPQVQDILILEVIGLYLQAALKRAIGDFKALKESLIEALSKAELIEPGLVTATVYVFAATVTDLVNLKEKAMNSPDILSKRALEHLQYVTEPSDVLADMKRKAHINLATFYLGCNISGQLVKDNIDILNLGKAETSIMAVNESVCKGNPLKGYHDVQFSLVLSINNYRHSQANCNQRTHFLRNAFNHAKKAECIARDHQFSELVEWSQANKALCTEELVREKLIELNLQFTVCA